MLEIKITEEKESEESHIEDEKEDDQHINVEDKSSNSKSFRWKPNRHEYLVQSLKKRSKSKTTKRRSPRRQFILEMNRVSMFY